MSHHAALRIAVRPIRGAALFDQFVSSKLPTSLVARRPFSQLLPLTRTSRARDGPRPTVCLRCSIRSRTRLQSLSTIPPPPPNPSTDSPTTNPAPSESSPLHDGRVLSSTVTDVPETRQADDKSTASSPPSSRPRLELPSYFQDRRHGLSARFSSFMDNFQSRVLNATQTINDLTGYSAIEAIKARNTQLETEHTAAQERLRSARQNYKTLTAHRAATQREVTTLLARKDTWSPPDLERFTTLYRADHELEAQVAAASAELTEAEADESRVGAELNAGILKRYHEEQIWSDGIRRQSTWGTWGLMGVNILLFLVLQFVAEPWRRARLVKGVAEREKTVMDEVRRELGEVRAALEASSLREQQKETVSAATVESQPAPEHIAAVEAAVTPEVVSPTAPTPEVAGSGLGESLSPSWKEVISDPHLLKAAILDLYSDRRIDVRMRDVSLLALEGAAAGAAVVGSLAFVLLRNR